MTHPAPVYDHRYITETQRITAELIAARNDLDKEPSYGRALAVQQTRRIRDERVDEVRSAMRVVDTRDADG